jgi:hypothetical protein
MSRQVRRGGEGEAAEEEAARAGEGEPQAGVGSGLQGRVWVGGHAWRAVEPAKGRVLLFLLFHFNCYQ